MSTKPTLRSAQALIATSTGALSPEWFRFLSELLAYTAALEARIAALEA